jgi:hypothetical protein
MVVDGGLWKKLAAEAAPTYACWLNARSCIFSMRSVVVANAESFTEPVRGFT